MTQPTAARPAFVPARLYLKRLGRILKMHRRLSRVGRQKVDSALRLELVGLETEPSWQPFLRLIDPKLGRGVKSLEDEGLSTETVVVPDIEVLARAYGIPSLMIDPARSKPVRSAFSVVDIRDFQAVSLPGVPMYGSGTEYAIPKEQLDGSENLAIVSLKFRARASDTEVPAHSDNHRHPGEEILLVDDGLVEMNFGESGLRCALKRDSLIHFDSSQDHGACNLTHQTSRSFIVRFYAPGNGAEQNWARLTSQQLQPPSLEGDSYVTDRHGLGDFLKLLRSDPLAGTRGGPLSLSDLAYRAERKGYGDDFTRSRLDRIHHGKSPLLKSELNKLAILYGIEPMVLYSFLLPSYRPLSAIAIHGEADMLEIKEDLPKGVSYKLPPRRLQGSRATVALLILQEGAKTKLNRHPGQEIVKPVDGKVLIEFEGIPREVKIGSFAHFFAYYDHRMINVHEGSTKLLVLRFPCS